MRAIRVTVAATLLVVFCTARSAWAVPPPNVIWFQCCGGFKTGSNYVGLDLCINWGSNCTFMPGQFCEPWKEGVTFPGSMLYSFTLQNETGSSFGTFTFHEGLQNPEDDQCVMMNSCFADEVVGSGVPPGSYRLVPGSNVTSSIKDGIQVWSPLFSVAAPTFPKGLYLTSTASGATMYSECSVVLMLMSDQLLFGSFNLMATNGGSSRLALKAWEFEAIGRQVYWNPKFDEEWEEGIVQFSKIETPGGYYIDNSTDYPEFTMAKCKTDLDCEEMPCMLKHCRPQGWCAIDDGINWPAGCFIATAAYGTPLDDRLCLLRWFRDSQLLPTAPGRAFVATYYAVSPPIARAIRPFAPLRMLVRGILWPIVWILEGRPAEVLRVPFRRIEL